MLLLWKQWKNSLNNLFNKKRIAKGNSAFTLFETVIALFIFVLLQGLLMLLFRSQLLYGERLATEYNDDWASFAIQLSREAKSAQFISENGRTFTLKDNTNRYITYEFYSNSDSQMIRKRVQGLGHQPMLMNVAYWEIESLSDQALKIKVNLTNGDSHELYLLYQKPLPK